MRRTILLQIILSCCFTVFAQQRSASGKQSVARGKLVYQQVCLSCHMADGGGVPNLNPPLNKSSWVSGDKKRLINTVLHGIQEKTPIDGHYYSNNMPPQSVLTDQQIADVLTYVRSNFGNKATAVNPSEVAAQREATK